MADKEYALAEYRALKDEINQLNSLASSALNFSVVVTAALLGYFVQMEKVDFLLFSIPFLIIIPCSYVILSRFQAIFRIASYIKVFLENHEGLAYETRMSILRARWLASQKRIQLTYRETILLLYLSLALICIGIFISKGFCSWYHFLAYTLPLPYYYHYYRLVRTDWGAIYEKHWQEIGRGGHKDASCADQVGKHA